MHSDQKRTEYVRVMLTRKEKNELLRLSELENLTVSRYIRKYALAERRKKLED